MMAKIFISTSSLFLLMILSCTTLSGQVQSGNDFLNRLTGPGEGSVKIQFEQEIEDNFFKHLNYNRKNPAVIGYRLRIYSGKGNNAPEAARQIRAQFLTKYEDIGAYLHYDAPDYKVYVGDCRTRSELLSLQQRIIKDFPNSFPVNMPINIGNDK